MDLITDGQVKGIEERFRYLKWGWQILAIYNNVP